LHLDGTQSLPQINHSVNAPAAPDPRYFSPTLLPETLLGEWPFTLFNADAFDVTGHGTGQPPQPSLLSVPLQPSLAQVDNLSNFDLLFGDTLQTNE
jgi:hypothetical protein